MQLRRPVFLFCFSRGGSNMLLNVFLSAPELCSAGAETQKIFEGRGIGDTPWGTAVKIVRNGVPLRWLAGQRFLRMDVHLRRPLSPRAQRFFDRVVARELLRARHPMHNLYKYQDALYTEDEIRDARPVFKSLDGLIFIAEEMKRMYPTSQFFFITRDGLALCESWMRRGRSAEEAGILYAGVVMEMLRFSEEHDDVHLLKLEDFLAAPLATATSLLQRVDVDVDKLSALRVQWKDRTNAEGIVHNPQGDREVAWLPKHEYDVFFDKTINENQKRKLATADREAFLSVAGDAMSRLSYATR